MELFKGFSRRNHRDVTMKYSYALVLLFGFFLSGAALQLQDVEEHLDTIEMNAKAVQLDDRNDAIKRYLSAMWRSTLILSESGYFEEPQLGQLFKIRGFISDADDILRRTKRFGNINSLMQKIIDLVKEIKEYTNGGDQEPITNTKVTSATPPFRPTTPPRLTKPTEPPKQQWSIWNPLKKLWSWTLNFFRNKILSYLKKGNPGKYA